MGVNPVNMRRCVGTDTGYNCMHQVSHPFFETTEFQSEANFMQQQFQGSLFEEAFLTLFSYNRADYMQLSTERKVLDETD